MTRNVSLLTRARNAGRRDYLARERSRYSLNERRELIQRKRTGRGWKLLPVERQAYAAEYIRGFLSGPVVGFRRRRA